MKVCPNAPNGMNILYQLKTQYNNLKSCITNVYKIRAKVPRLKLRAEKSIDAYKRHVAFDDKEFDDIDFDGIDSAADAILDIMDVLAVF